ncbi:MAG: DUF3106 domain-containing protein [Comamonadaceae bacterium]|nr:DUF3106 domain-containing protein [Comamonadaceae bacterium]RRD57001.1 DUF3106 domain-containing protein [Comamonadaceae bacterium OH2545_COT-014]
MPPFATLFPALAAALPAIAPLMPLLAALAPQPAHAQPHPPAIVLAQAPGSVSWQALSAGQQAALAPLAGLWHTMSDEQQRQWMALARNYRQLSPDGQATLQARMAEWAALTPQQRTQARLNFGETRRVPADEKKAQWQAYQALPPEERRRLAQDHPAPPGGTAPALHPTPPSQLPRLSGPSAHPAHGAPNHIDQNTLLPRQPR